MEVYQNPFPARYMKSFMNIRMSLSPLSLDEAFLDVTENKPGIPLAVDIAKEIKQKVRNELNLVASAGISYNKFLSKDSVGLS